MPATEQTWRNLNTMHVVFGLTSLGMLVATIFLLAVDNVREWKAYQRQFRDIETWSAESRVHEEQTGEYAAKTQALKEALKKVLETPPDAGAVDTFVSTAASRATQNGYSLSNLKSASEAAAKTDTPEEVKKNREALIAEMDKTYNRAKFIEDEAQRALKFERANLDVVMSGYSIAIDEKKSDRELANAQAKIDAVKANVDGLNSTYESAKSHRLSLQASRAKVQVAETEARKAVADHDGDVKRLQTAVYERGPNKGKSVLEMPIIDAFGRPLKIEQIWLPTLTLNNNFRDVARFDRCTTCHQGIDKTAPGSAINPGYEAVHSITAALPTPKAAPAAPEDGKAQSLNAKLGALYGMTLSAKGVVKPNDVVVEVVWPEQPAAKAGIRSGDVIERIGDAPINTVQRAETYLLQSVDWGKPLEITLRRGAPQPFTSHPRLDLFVGSLSPHKMGDFGCTICHEGQGSATEFKWASHTPNDPRKAHEWSTEHGWFNNHHWIFPMLPERFAESSCLKCHHEVVELQPSERFPDPPAPKLVGGWETIKDIGCFGCHEINGYDGPSKRRGPDLRAEPNYAAVAQQLAAEAKLTGELALLAQELTAHPDRTPVRKRLAEEALKDEKLSVSAKKLAGMLAADDETPGKLRKVGPSLRHLGSKVDLDFLYDWIENPRRFRPSTKMPKFFGLHDHLSEVVLKADGSPELDEHGHAKTKGGKGLGEAEKFEPIEIRAMSEYLLSASLPFKHVGPLPGQLEAPSAERGKTSFELRGCLACHKHPDFPKAQQTQGPDLAKLGGKLRGDKGSKWLYSWLREPTHYHARTSMPNTFLEPTTLADGKKVDPAADIVAYLLGQKDFTPVTPPGINTQALEDLVQKFLKGAFNTSDSMTFAKTGIPADRGASGDESLLVMGNGDLTKQKLIYAGKKSIARLGCAGCHDVPGFEDAKPIGTGLADWGRKETSKLAFEQIVAYVEGKAAAHGHGGHIDVHHMEPDEGFFTEALLGHHREGFIWQKLREPRSYDYKKTENKDYLDRLRMPQFNLTDAQRESIMTFVLGLVAEPPAAKYVYKPSPRNLAIQKGRDVLERFNCVGCHTIDMETWDFDYDPHSMPAPPPVDLAKEYEFTLPHFAPPELASSQKIDRRGLGHARITGMPNPEVQEDPDTGKPLHYFAPWKPAAINGQVWTVGGPEIGILQEQITKKYAPYGGELSRYLHPLVLANEKKANPNAKASDAWGWVPPPLVGEGQKVRPEWLYEFLLEPYPIRPPVVLRMPKFNLSPTESAALVDYFAAKDNAQYPYEFDTRTWKEFTMSTEERSAFNTKLDGALKIVTDNNYCVKCHLVGDYIPPGSVAALAPQLDRVSERLRPGFLQQWLAKPTSKLPYTGMPINFPKDKPADQKLLAGTAEQQLQSVVDLLLNWTKQLKDLPSNSIKARVKPPAAAAPAATGGE